MEKRKKWYHTQVGIGLLLLLFFPAGLYLMWKYTNWHRKVKWGVTGFYGLMFVLTAIFSPSESYTDSINKAQEKVANERINQAASQTLTEAPKQVEKYKVEVTSQIVKKVDGKYRYFFDIRNNDTKNFEGDVSITLFNELQKNPLGGDTFSTTRAIEPTLGTSQYIDIYTGPVSIHGGNGITKFKFVVKKNGEIVNEGEGQITTKYEDIDGFSL